MAKSKARPKRKAKPKAERITASGLTVKQQQFVNCYFGGARYNGTEAARQAGYASPEVEACRLLRNANVREEVDRRLSEAAMAANEVLARLSEEAAASIGDFVDVTEDGYRLNLKKAADAGKLHLIKKLSPTKYGTSIELHDAQAAKALLGRYHGLFVDRHKHEFADISDEELIARAKGALGGDGAEGTDP